MRVKLPVLSIARISISRLPKKRTLIIFGTLALILIGICVLIVYRNRTSTISIPPASASRVEGVSKDFSSKLLKKGDLQAYEANQRGLADLYLGHNDIKNAERIMDDIFKKVPEGQVGTSTYELMANIQKVKGDTPQHKHYLEILIPKLMAKKNTQAADYYQKELKAL